MSQFIQSLRNKNLPLIVCIILIMVLQIFSWVEASVTHPVKVAVINSYHQGYDWSDKVIQGVLERLHASNYPIDIHVEHLDLKRLPIDNHEELVTSFLKRKYKGSNFDLIILVDNPAFDLVLRHRNDLFPNVPIVFAGINNFTSAMIQGQEKITGVAEIQDNAGTISLALMLHPDTKRILAVHDYTSSGLALRKELETAFMPFRDRVQLDFNEQGSFSEVAAQIASLETNEIALILSFATDVDGKSLRPSQSTQVLTSGSRVPVYATHETRLGFGIVGGLLISGVYHGTQAGEIALRVLTGENPDDIPVKIERNSIPMFDYQLLTKFGIDPAVLPSESILVGRPHSFYEENKTIVWMVSLIFMLLTSLVIALVILLAGQRKAKSEIRESEERFRRLAEDMPALICTFHQDSTLTYVNNAICRFSGRSANELVGMKFYDLISEKEKNVIRENLNLLNRENPIIRREHDVSDPQGKNTKQLWITRAFFDDLNRVTFYQAIGLDITDLKRTEEALRENEEKYRAVFNSATIGIGILDLSGTITQTNNAAAKMLEYSQEELAGLSIYDLTAAHDADRTATNFGSLIRGEIDSYRLEKQYVKKSGDSMWADVSVSAIRNNQGECVSVLGVILDISERKKAHEVLVHSERIKAVAELSSGVSHNFNNALQIIIGGTSLAKMSLESGDISEIGLYLDQVMESARFGSETIKRLNEFARSHRESDSLETKTFDLSITAQQAISMSKHWWKTQAERKGIKIKLTFEPANDLLIKGMENEIFEVIVNLVKNSVEALPQGGNIHIAVSKENDFAVLCVQDDGIGIPQEHLGHVFEPFWTTKGYEGTGMGLAGSYGIVQAHKGEIFVESRIGQGTKFTIKLPLSNESFDQDEPTQLEFPWQLSFLLVDDQKQILDVFTDTLRRLDQQVFAASSGAEAIRLFSENAIDVVVCDLGMPEMNGRQTVKAIRRKSEELSRKKPICILITGWGDHQSDDEELFDSAIDMVVEKPITIHNLLHLVKTLL